ncbi:MAG: nucleotidyl transferase AbiEii/AbiGii toxin family protein [Pseudonocardiaceae bacterium]
MDLGRLRRRVVFDRVAVRLAVAPGGGWVLKGGAALEFRLLDRARMTKDLDLAIRSNQSDGSEVRESLIDALATDPDQDGFAFRVGAPMPLAVGQEGRPAWRFSVEAWLAAKLFAIVRLDIAARPEELARTEFVELPGTLSFAGVPPRSIEAVDRLQHFAEKLHALTREYPDRSNTRIKDLADLVLLIETGLSANRVLVNTVGHVFAMRDTHPVPVVIQDPPPAWEAGYPEIAAGLTNTRPDVISALALVRAFWSRALNSDYETDG